MIKIDKFIQTKRKSLKIEITAMGEIVVFAPLKMDMNTIQNFIYGKEDWIVKKQTEIKSRVNLYEGLFNYSKILLLGEIYNIINSNIKEITKINNDIFLPNYINKRKQVYKLEKYLKQYATEIIKSRTAYFCNLMQLEPSEIKFSNAKKKWGSCDANDKIMLNWRLIMLPPKLIDYVIIHELAHMIELNHSSSFWCIVASICPQWKEVRGELKKCGFILETFRRIE